ncbi:MAG: transcriptional repressor LexA [Oscillospiraceae bacterium]|jgi:repressor LexA|nr:transcriptional repressor LexA [Oscillospiraceae bacterium]
MRRSDSKQSEIYQFILSATARQGYPPSVREIGAAVGLRSPSTVHGYLKRLHEAGLIVRDERKTRAICVPESAPGVPILGEVTAGRPILAYEQDLGTLPYDPGDGGEFFALCVSGDSMVGAGILDGDYVVVRRQATARTGEIVVALLGDEATVKRLEIAGGAVRLLPENPAYEPIDGSDCAVLGRVTAVIRQF